jgi:hypothetical protein
MLALALFLIRWPLDNYTCSMATWGKWRPSPAEGVDFVQTVFRGGGGTPAVFAMLGGQRYMVANIMWMYADVLFHKGKLWEMVAPMDATITLNPAFTEAWSTYGWHLAWNLYSYTDDPIEKRRWLDAGIQVYIRAVKAEPSISVHRVDLARVYSEREGNILKAMKVLQPIVESGHFKPLTTELKNRYQDDPDVTDYYWDPYSAGHPLAICYKRLGLFTGDWRYMQKAIDTYKYCETVDPAQKSRTQPLIDEIQQHMYDRQYLLQQRKIEDAVRQNFGEVPLTYDIPADKMFPDQTTGVENVPLPVQ